MRALQLYSTEQIDDIYWPEHSQPINLNSPALTIFTDFKNVVPLTLGINTAAIDALKQMRQSHVRLKLIVDTNNRLLGIVTLDHMHEQEIMKRVAHGFTRDDLQVKHFMIHKQELKAFDYQELERASIHDILETLKSHSQQHSLVLDRGSSLIRGVISASDIARRLRIAVDISNESTFANIFNAIKS